MYSYPTYKNFDDLESNLTQQELVKLYEKAHEKNLDDKRFFAAMQGIDLDKNTKSTSDFEAVKRRAEAKALGLDEEAYDLNGLFDIVEE